MSFEILASSFKLERRRRNPLAEAVRIGLFAGLAAIAFALIGAYVTMDARAVIEGVLSLGQTFMLLIGLAAGVLGARAAGAQGPDAIKFGAVAGLVAGILLVVLVLAVAH